MIDATVNETVWKTFNCKEIFSSSAKPVLMYLYISQKMINNYDDCAVDASSNCNLDNTTNNNLYAVMND